MQQSTAHATTTQADVSNYMQSALTYYKYFQWERAIDNFSRVIECNSRETLDSQVQDNPLSQERKPLDEVMRRDQVLLAYRCRGKLFHIKHDYKRAVDDLSHAIRLEPSAQGSETSFIVRGDAFYSMKKYTEAIQDYSMALNALENLYNREQASARTTRTLGSIVMEDETSRLLKNNPCVQTEQDNHLQGLSASGQLALHNLAELYIKRGNAYRYSNHHEKALHDFSRVTELCPNDIRGFSLRAALLDHLERFQEAKKDYETVVRMDPTQQIANTRLHSLHEMN